MTKMTRQTSFASLFSLPRLALLLLYISTTHAAPLEGPIWLTRDVLSRSTNGIYKRDVGSAIIFGVVVGVVFILGMISLGVRVAYMKRRELPRQR
jgi:hypothetical protein